jgi:hypothetical protein
VAREQVSLPTSGFSILLGGFNDNRFLIDQVCAGHSEYQ